MNKNKLLLITPPGWDISQPYLALPQLKGFANTLGGGVQIFDDNIQFFDWILSEKFVNPILDEIINQYESLNNSNCNKINNKIFNKLRLFHIYEEKIRDLNSAKQKLKSTNSPKIYKENLRIIYAALSSIGWHYNMELAPYKVESTKYDTKTIDGVIEFSNDLMCNVFYNYYYDGKGKDVVTLATEFQHIGLSVTSRSQLLSALTFVNILKSKNSSTIVHLGGSFISRMVNYVHEETLIKFLHNVDFLFRYEGETLVKNLIAGEEYKNIPNVIYQENDKLYFNSIEEYHPIHHITPDFDGLNFNLYLSSKIALPLVSSIGCYSRCAFCTIPQGNSSNQYYQFDLNEIAKSIASLKKKYSTSFFTFNDETFNLKKMVEFSKIIASQNIRWIAETRFDERLSDEDFKLIVDSGCSYLEFGLESYNQRVLDLMMKNTKIDDINYTLKQCYDYKLPVHLFAMFGFPGETLEEIENTKDFLHTYLNSCSENGIEYTSTGFGPFGLEYGSKVYQHPEKYGIIIHDNLPNSIDLDYNYSVGLNEVTPKNINDIVESITYSTDTGFQDHLPQSFAMINPSPISEEQPYVDSIFEDNYDTNGINTLFKYIYNYEKQWLIPVNNNVPVNTLMKIYGHLPADEFDVKSHYRINPFVSFDNNIIVDNIRNIQFKIPEKILAILYRIKNEGSEKNIGLASLQLNNELIIQMEKLFKHGLIIKQN